jgi:hypothetical protein
MVQRTLHLLSWKHKMNHLAHIETKLCPFYVICHINIFKSCFWTILRYCESKFCKKTCLHILQTNLVSKKFERIRLCKYYIYIDSWIEKDRWVNICNPQILGSRLLEKYNIQKQNTIKKQTPWTSHNSILSHD